MRFPLVYQDPSVYNEQTKQARKRAESSRSPRSNDTATKARKPTNNQSSSLEKSKHKEHNNIKQSHKTVKLEPIQKTSRISNSAKSEPHLASNEDMSPVSNVESDESTVTDHADRSSDSKHNTSDSKHDLICKLSSSEQMVSCSNSDNDNDDDDESVNHGPEPVSDQDRLSQSSHSDHDDDNIHKHSSPGGRLISASDNSDSSTSTDRGNNRSHHDDRPHGDRSSSASDKVDPHTTPMSCTTSHQEDTRGSVSSSNEHLKHHTEDDNGSRKSLSSRSNHESNSQKDVVDGFGRSGKDNDSAGGGKDNDSGEEGTLHNSNSTLKANDDVINKSRDGSVHRSVGSINSSASKDDVRSSSGLDQQGNISHTITDHSSDPDERLHKKDLNSYQSQDDNSSNISLNDIDHAEVTPAKSEYDNISNNNAIDNDSVHGDQSKSSTWEQYNEKSPYVQEDGSSHSEFERKLSSEAEDDDYGRMRNAMIM